MIKLDFDYVNWIISGYKVRLADDLKKQKDVLAELLEHKGTTVVDESIANQEKNIAYTQSELDRIEQFYAQFPKPLYEYELFAEERQ